MNKILFLDTLGTGPNPDRYAIYRLGGIYTENGVEKNRFEFRMRPYRNARIQDQSLWIGGESRSSLIYYPDEAKVLKDFVGYLSGIVDIRNPKDKLYIAGFNVAAFDAPFIRSWFLRNGNENFRNYFFVQTIDLMSIAAFTLMEQRRSMPDFHLETAARYLGVRIESGDKYDSIRNAKISLDIYRNLQVRYGLAECIDTSVATEIIKNF